MGKRGRVMGEEFSPDISHFWPFPGCRIHGRNINLSGAIIAELGLRAEHSGRGVGGSYGGPVSVLLGSSLRVHSHRRWFTIMEQRTVTTTSVGTRIPVETITVVHSVYMIENHPLLEGVRFSVFL